MGVVPVPAWRQEAEHRPRVQPRSPRVADAQGAGYGHAGPGPECDPDPEAET